MKEQVQYLGKLSYQEFLQEIKTRKGNLSGCTYEVTQNAFLSNYNLNEGEFSCGIAAKFSRYPHPIHLGKGKFTNLTISWLECPSLDISECTFRVAVYLDKKSVRTKDKGIKLGTVALSYL